MADYKAYKEKLQKALICPMMEKTKGNMEAIEANLSEQRRIVAYLNELQAKVDALRPP